MKWRAGRKRQRNLNGFSGRIRFQLMRRKRYFFSSPKDRSEFIIEVPDAVRALFSAPRLGERFPCKTGISTGNDKTYLSPIRQKGFTVPFYKNPGNRRFFACPDAYLRDDYRDVAESRQNFIIRNKPYIRSSRHHLFVNGRSIRGRDPPRRLRLSASMQTFSPTEEDRWWLLCFLNSSLCNYLGAWCAAALEYDHCRLCCQDSCAGHPGGRTKRIEPDSAGSL